MDWTTIVTCILTSITTISVAALGLYQTRKSKETEDYRKLRDSLEKERQEKLKEEKEREEERLDAIEKSLKEMRTDVESLKDDMDTLKTTNITGIKTQLEHLHLIQTSNFSYIESLSNVVVQIGESLDSSNAIDDNNKKSMTEQITNHKAIESRIHQQLLQVIA